MCAPFPSCLADLGYDPNGNVISKTTPAGTTTFSYDPLDRIDLEAGPAGTRNHDFDAGGNRTSDGAGTTASFTPSTDRLATINGVSVTLDAAGNLTSDGTYKYLWNGLGQLAELRKPDNTLVASYYYDHQNLRTRKVTTAAAPQGVTKTFYHYDQAGHLIAETSPGNLAQATYIWNGDIFTGLIVHQPQRTVYTVQTDHLGSPFQVRTLAGTVVWRWESEAFGKTAPNDDVDGNGTKVTLNLRFPGQYYDRESGLHYNWNRYYSPKLARYLSPDPIGLSGGTNLYAYVGGNPISFIDPLGLAQIGSRPLDVGWLPGNGRGLLRHDQIWYDDKQSPDNSGFFDDDSIRADRGHTRDEFNFSRDPRIYDDSLMREAEKNIRKNWDKDWRLRSNDCQDYANAARSEYDRLFKQRQRFGIGR